MVSLHNWLLFNESFVYFISIFGQSLQIYAKVCWRKQIQINDTISFARRSQLNTNLSTITNPLQATELKTQSQLNWEWQFEAISADNSNYCEVDELNRNKTKQIEFLLPDFLRVIIFFCLIVITVFFVLILLFFGEYSFVIFIFWCARRMQLMTELPYFEGRKIHFLSAKDI